MFFLGATGSTFVSSRPVSASQSDGGLQPSATIPTDVSKPSNYGLSGDCLNKLCLMMEYALVLFILTKLLSTIILLTFAFHRLARLSD